MLYIPQCRKSPLGASGSSTTRAKLRVPSGVPVHFKGEKVSTVSSIFPGDWLAICKRRAHQRQGHRDLLWYRRGLVHFPINQFAFVRLCFVTPSIGDCSVSNRFISNGDSNKRSAVIDHRARSAGVLICVVLLLRRQQSSLKCHAPTFLSRGHAIVRQAQPARYPALSRILKA